MDRFYVKDGQTVKCQGQAPKGRMQSWNCRNGVGHRVNASCLCIFLPREQWTLVSVSLSRSTNQAGLLDVGYRSQGYFIVASHLSHVPKIRHIQTLNFAGFCGIFAASTEELSTPYESTVATKDTLIIAQLHRLCFRLLSRLFRLYKSSAVQQCCCPRGKSLSWSLSLNLSPWQHRCPTDVLTYLYTYLLTATDHRCRRRILSRSVLFAKN